MRTSHTLRTGITTLSLLLVFVASCMRGQPDGRGGTQPAPPEEQEHVVGAGADRYTSGGGSDQGTIGLYPLNINIFEGLVRMDAQYNVLPSLATSWEFLPPNTWRFELRRGVRFHDGQRFDAEAVKHTFNLVAEGGGGTPGFGEDSTEIIDDYTIEVTPMFENRRLPQQLVHPNYFIVAPGTEPNDDPVGTGPFKFVSYRPQEEIVVARNDDYWGELPTLRRITFRFIPNDNGRRLALEAREVDMALDIPPDAVGELEARGFTVEVGEPGAYEAIYLNKSGRSGYTILTDERVRHAIGYAIDREALVEGVFEGYAAREQTMVPSRLLGEAAGRIEGYEHDPAQAEALLEEAGWMPGPDGIRQKGGEPLRLELIAGFPSAEEHGAVPEFLQDQLRRVGIDVEIIRTPDTASYEARLDRFAGDLWLEQGSQNDANPAFLPALLFWSIGLFGNIGYQPVFAPKGRFDEVIARAVATPDEEELKELTAEALHILIDQEAIVIPLAGVVTVNVLDQNVEGFEAAPSGLHNRYDTVYIAE